MESSKLAFKFFLTDPIAIGAGELVPVFHAWIQSHALPDHLLIDVADYQHVAEGPVILLVSQEANLALDKGAGQTGLLYTRKQPLPGTFADRLRTVLHAALDACARLEREPALAGRLTFRTDAFLFRVNDRLHAPNERATFVQVEPDLKSVLSEIWGRAVELEYQPAPLELFEVRVKAPSAPGVAELAQRASASVVAG